MYFIHWARFWVWRLIYGPLLSKQGTSINFGWYIVLYNFFLSFSFFSVYFFLLLLYLLIFFTLFSLFSFFNMGHLLMALIPLNNTDTVIEHTRLDSDIESKSLNNTYLNIIQILFLLFFFISGIKIIKCKIW